MSLSCTCTCIIPLLSLFDHEQVGLCLPWSETRNKEFLAMRFSWRLDEVGSVKPFSCINDYSKVVRLTWFSMLLVFVSVSVLLSPYIFLDDLN